MLKSPLRGKCERCHGLHVDTQKKRMQDAQTQLQTPHKNAIARRPSARVPSAAKLSAQFAQNLTSTGANVEQDQAPAFEVEAVQERQGVSSAADAACD